MIFRAILGLLLLAGAAQAQNLPTGPLAGSLGIYGPSASGFPSPSSSVNANIYPGATLDFNFASGFFYPASASLTVTSAGPGTAVDASGTWHQFASGVARITSGVGLTVEESRTNSIRSNVSATNWTLSTLNNVTLSAGSPFVSQGVTFVPVTLNGTANASSTVCPILLEATTQISAAQNQVWSESAFVTTSGKVPAVLLDINERNSGGTSVNDNQTAISPSAIFTRYQTSASLSNSGTAYTVPEICFTTVNTTAYSGTINIGWPQMEQNSGSENSSQAFATTPIVTTGSAVTRARDVVAVTVPTNACSSTQCSVIGTATPENPNPAFGQNLFDLNDGTSNNRLTIGRFGVNFQPSLTQTIAGAIYGSILPVVNWIQFAQGKISALATPSSGIVIFNNQYSANQTVPSLPSFSQAYIGSQIGNPCCMWNGTIARVAVASVSLLND